MMSKGSIFSFSSVKHNNNDDDDDAIYYYEYDYTIWYEIDAMMRWEWDEIRIRMRWGCKRGSIQRE